MIKCKVHLKSGNIIKAICNNDDWDEICSAFLARKPIVFSFNNCQIYSDCIEALEY